MPTKFDLRQAQELVEKIGLIPKFKEYLGSTDAHKVQCKCGEEFDLLFSTVTRRLKQNPEYILKCKKCVDSEKKGTKYTPEVVFNLFLSKGLTPLFSKSEIENLQKSTLNREFRRTPLKYRCRCGVEGALPLGYFLEELNDRKDLYCRSCSAIVGGRVQKFRKQLKDNLLEFSQRFNLKIENFDEIKNNYDKVKFYCTCGNLHTVSWGSLSKWTKQPLCYECQNKNKPSGKEHSCYKPDLTAEDRNASVYGRGNLVACWASLIRKTYGFRCAVMGEISNKLNVHHIYPWSFYPKERYCFENGLPLQEKVHKEFHDKYGKHVDNSKDFFEFFSQKTNKNLKLPAYRHQIISEEDV